MRFPFFKRFGLILLAIMLAGGAMAEEAALSVSIRTGTHDTFQRLVFDWPAKVSYSAKQNGAVLTLHFEKAAQVDLSSVSNNQLSFIKSATQNRQGDATDVALTLAEGIVAENFQNESRVVVDLHPGTTPAPPREEPQAAAQPAAPPPSKGIDAPGVRPPLPAPPDLSKLGDEPLELISINPGLGLPIAVWKRADYAYIGFDRRLTARADQISSNAIVKLENTPSGDGSVYRFYLPQEVSLHVTKEGNTWLLFARKKGRSAPISLTVTPQPSYALGARILIPISKAGDPVRYTDPDVGDTLMVVPLSEPAQAVRVPHRYADVEFYPAEQGVVVIPRTDDLAVRRQTQGVEITREGGLRLSPDEDTGYARTDGGGAESTYLFEFTAWYGPRDIPYTVMRQRWVRALSEVQEDERDRMRLEMARFQFARGHYQEASGQLDELVRRLPDLETRAEFLSLRGATRVMINHDGAVNDLSHPELANKPEAKLWLANAYVRLGEWKKAMGLFMETDGMLKNYPEPYFTRFSINAAEAALASSNRTYAATVLDRLVHHHPEMESSSGAVAYLRGVFLSQAGHYERAQELWTRAAQSHDLLYRVRAIVSLTDLQVLKGKISPKEAAERLEHLRFVWRGDDLELDILRRLGKFYIEAGKVAEGLSTLKQVLAFLPDNEAAKTLRKEMASAFRDVFLSDQGQKLSPLDALSLYERFYELAPEGEEGDALIRTLADRMVAVDLLDRAADILSDQARRRLTSTFKARVGAEAAGIYLLDLNPKSCLKILEDTEQVNLPADLVEQRTLLKARAFSDLGKREEAEALIADFKSENALRLRVDMAWRAKEWAIAAKHLAEMTGDAAPEEELNEKQVQLLLDRAVAYAMAQDAEGLNNLYKNFGEAMKKKPQGELFKAITQAENGIPREKDIATLTAIDLFQEYLEDYRKILK
jgi:hypothetical protein